MEHTPGPWWHDTVTLYAGPAGDNEGSIQPLTADVVLRETIANLNLCAAAPDLLDACEALLEVLGGIGTYDMGEIKEMAEEAVRKARGG
jgi:hypothetical protein